MQALKNKVSIEQVYLMFLSSVLIFSCIIAFLNGYTITWDFYIAAAGLLVLAFISFAKPKFLLPGLIVLLTIGSFHLLSFLYFFNIFFGLSFGKIGTPKLQLFSLVLLLVLVLLRKKNISSFLKTLRKSNDIKLEENSKQLFNQYIKKFENLSDSEIVKRLNNKLVPEAREALLEILNSRSKV
jgi:hypothetical protein